MRQVGRKNDGCDLIAKRHMSCYYNMRSIVLLFFNRFLTRVRLNNNITVNTRDARVRKARPKGEKC